MKSYITQEDLERLAEFSIKVGIDAYREEHERVQKRKARERRRNIINACRSLKWVKKQMEEETEFTKDEQIELRWKFLKGMMEDSELKNIDQRLIDDDVHRRQYNLDRINKVEKALDLLKQECEASPYPEPKRWYRVFMMRYVNMPEMSIESIAEAEDISDVTVKRDIRCAANLIDYFFPGVFDDW